MNKLLWIVIFFSIGCKSDYKKNSDQKDNTPISNNSKNQDSAFLMRYSLTSLMKKSPAEIGCMLQEEFNYKDSVFNCENKNYSNRGDPCKKTVEYYEGIKIPDELAHKIDPFIKKIALDFEHGNLQHMMVTFEDSMLITKIRSTYNLPVKEKYPKNIIDIDYGENIFSAEKPININYTKWLSITAFDHVGAGEMGCK